MFRVLATNPGVKLVRLDTYDFTQSALQNARGLGLNFTTVACLPHVRAELLGAAPVYSASCSDGPRVRELLFVADIVLSSHQEE
jgi:hypothetical protein